jgi:hypothetical protein
MQQHSNINFIWQVGLCPEATKRGIEFGGSDVGEHVENPPPLKVSFSMPRRADDRSPPNFHLITPCDWDNFFLQLLLAG